MPEKLTIYSTLVGWLNAQSDSFGAEFIKYILSQVKEMIVQCRWEAARYMFRFITGTWCISYTVQLYKNFCI